MEGRIRAPTGLVFATCDKGSGPAKLMCANGGARQESWGLGGLGFLMRRMGMKGRDREFVVLQLSYPRVPRPRDETSWKNFWQEVE